MHRCNFALESQYDSYSCKPIVYNDLEWEYLHMLVPPLNITQIVLHGVLFFSVHGSISKAGSTIFQT